MVTYIKALFGNPLNKIKKNVWLEQRGRNEVLGNSLGLTDSSLRSVGRDTIDNELLRARNAAAHTFRQRYDLQKLAKTAPDYTDMYFDQPSGQYMGFPKVNGYMEVPLPNQRELLDRIFEPTNTELYIDRKAAAMAPTRYSKPRGLANPPTVDGLY